MDRENGELILICDQNIRIKDGEAKINGEKVDLRVNSGKRVEYVYNDDYWLDLVNKHLFKQEGEMLVEQTVNKYGCKLGDYTIDDISMVLTQMRIPAIKLTLKETKKVMQSINGRSFLQDSPLTFIFCQNKEILTNSNISTKSWEVNFDDNLNCTFKTNKMIYSIFKQDELDIYNISRRSK